MEHLPHVVPLGAEEEAALATKIQAGDRRALDRLVRQYMALVWWVYNREFKRWVHADREEMIQEGNLGLVIAARKFDPSFGVRFKTYAVFWVRAHMIDCSLMARGGQVRIGRTNVQRAVVLKLTAVQESLRKRGLPDDADHVAEELGIKDHGVVQALVNRMTAVDLPLDVVVHPEDGPRPQRMMGTGEPSAEDLLAEASEQADIAARVRRGMSQLDQRYADILSARMGGKTLTEIGDRYGVSRERIRQIEAKAKKQLRASIAREDRSEAHRVKGDQVSPRQARR